MAWTYEVKVANDEKWYGNAMRFATENEARIAGLNKYTVWTMCIDYRVIEAEGKVNWEMRNDTLSEVREA